MGQQRNNQRGRIAPKQIQLIKMAQKELQISDDNYRAMLRERFGAKSCTALTYSQAAELIDQFCQWGFVIIGKKGKPQTPVVDPSRKLQIEKIGALLAVGKRPWKYADALAKNICKVERLQWVPTSDLYKIITALQKQAGREGWNVR